MDPSMADWAGLTLLPAAGSNALGGCALGFQQLWSGRPGTRDLDMSKPCETWNFALCADCAGIVGPFSCPFSRMNHGHLISM